MTGGSAAKGAIVGWGESDGTKNVTDCLYVMANGQNTANLDLVRLYKGTVDVTNCYKTNNAGSNGTLCVVTSTVPFDLGTLKQDYGIRVKAYDNGICYDDTYYMLPATLSGSGTEKAPYLIRSVYEWDSFTLNVNNYSGKYVQLAEDISVSTMAGTSEANSFQGTFLGNGHTITANITDTGNQGTALFRYINGATIKDLTVGGTITGGMHAAAIVGFAQGTGNSIRHAHRRHPGPRHHQRHRHQRLRLQRHDDGRRYGQGSHRRMGRKRWHEDRHRLPLPDGRRPEHWRPGPCADEQRHRQRD